MQISLHATHKIVPDGVLGWLALSALAALIALSTMYAWSACPACLDCLACLPALFPEKDGDPGFCFSSLLTGVRGDGTRLVRPRRSGRPLRDMIGLYTNESKCHKYNCAILTFVCLPATGLPAWPAKPGRHSLSTR